MGSDGIYGGEAKSKRCVFRYFLKVANEMAERTDSCSSDGRQPILLQDPQRVFLEQHKWTIRVIVWDRVWLFRKMFVTM